MPTDTEEMAQILLQAAALIKNTEGKKKKPSRQSGIKKRSRRMSSTVTARTKNLSARNGRASQSKRQRLVTLPLTAPDSVSSASTTSSEPPSPISMEPRIVDQHIRHASREIGNRRAGAVELGAWLSAMERNGPTISVH
eukprot:CAMPEP_0185263876 /NCGR_PEP_ID=MMETSP1359-20130426/16935_1 /TAXON_ID=552665 /ORGANISM="Bigelowiella longifila, Strain CCMP242" /LENGTH=138 /DNA_ID=CAMNT_0027851747 /DNA_START=8 /DNA_END=424 /DNA_ORIENTATION=-